MKAIFIALIFLVGMASAVVDLSGTSPDVAKGFAKANSLDGFSDWVLPAYGHYATEFWPDVDIYGRPNSLTTFIGADVPIPPSIQNNTTQ